MMQVERSAAGERGSQTADPSRAAPWLLALLPCAVLVATAARLAVDVPYWDAFEFTPLLGRFLDGNWRLWELAAQHNEHRMVFPRLIWMLLARATAWDTRYEVAVALAVALALALATVLLLARAATRATGTPWMAPLVALLLTSLRQWENWLWGWQLQVFLSLLAVVGGLLVLAGASAPWRRQWIASLLGVVASFSYAAGLVFWPAAAPLLLLDHANRRRRLLAWAAATTLVALVYLHNFHTIGVHPSPWLVLSAPRASAAYLLAFLGSPLVTDRDGHSLAIGLGLAGLVFSILASGLASGRLLWAPGPRSNADRACAALGALALFAVGAALLTALGRAGFGLSQARTSRYVALSSFLWLWVLVAGVRHARAASGWPRAALALAVAAVAVRIVLASAGGAGAAQRAMADRIRGRAALLAGGPDADLALLYPDPAELRRLSAILAAHRLSCFR